MERYSILFNLISFFSTDNDLQHQTWLLSLNGRLSSVPLRDLTGAILDIGCGTGAWALAVAKERPDLPIIATDLTPPKITLPANLQIVESDADKEWDFNTRFSFIHCRMLASGIHDWPGLLSRCWDHLESGGWIELLDACHPFRAQDPAADQDSSSFIRWGYVAERCWAAKGLDYRATTKHRERLQALGFVDIREQELKWPLGEWGDTPLERDIGRLTMENFRTFLATAGVRIISHDSALSEEEAHALVTNAQQDLEENNDTKRFYLTM
ncbi:MAG: hypothetical protein Q9184_005542 [Pyrenodesmia sp. 2 TL-2023]